MVFLLSQDLRISWLMRQLPKLLPEEWPLSVEELKQVNLLPKTIEEAIFQGSYPQIYAENITPERLYANYIRLYVERDVRQIKNITDLEVF